MNGGDRQALETGNPGSIPGTSTIKPGTPVCLQLEITAEDEYRVRDVVSKWKNAKVRGVKSCLDKHQGSGWAAEDCFDLVERLVTPKTRGLLIGWLRYGDLQDYFLSELEVEMRNNVLESVYVAILEVDDVAR